MNRVLLTVSGNIDQDIENQIAKGARPTADYIAIARKINADLIDYKLAQELAGWFGRVLEWIGGRNLVLAWCCFLKRKDYQVIFTDGEQIGIPFAILLKFLGFSRRPRHIMIAHILSVRKKMLFFDWLSIADYIDTFIVYATWQKQFIEARWKVPAERVVFTPFMVDAVFFSQQKVKGEVSPKVKEEYRPPMICAVGLEFRDYPTLIQAVKGLDVQVVIAAASPWSKRKDSTSNQEIPENVIIQRFSQFELRELYAASRFMVMPLYNVNFQAGVTAILEAMAMERAVICSRTPGQTDVIIQDETGVYVTPENPAELRLAIERLLADPEMAEAMGKKGRQRVIDMMSLECYVNRLADLAG